ncbi:MAG: hypothetical protein E7562_04015 [Ruminococcaceae bacterium]|nr:hypothetical protein [Oscillospiraceae bacterium]
MQKINLFDFMNDPIYKLMLDMSKETHTQEELQDIKERFEAADKKRLFAECHEHQLDGVVGTLALKLGLEFPDEWKQEYEKQKIHLEFLREKAKEICKIMDENGIPMVILKNGGIMIGMIEDAVKCPMEDIDSLIKKSDFYKAHEILVNNGFVFRFRSDYEAEKLDEAYRDGSTEYYIITPNGEKMWFELAWRAVAGRWIRPDLEPDTDAFIDNSIIPDGTRSRILSPEDNLLQVCIHTAKHSYVRAPGLRLHMDVDRIVSHNKIDWDLFIKKVCDTHVKGSTYLSLYIPTVLFGTNIPSYVLEALRPKKEKKLLKMLASAKLLHPNGRKFSKLQFLRFQTALYDSKKDMLRVIYPSKEWMRERYNCRSSWQIFKCTIARFLDLVGIRKKKSN